MLHRLLTLRTRFLSGSVVLALIGALVGFVAFVDVGRAQALEPNPNLELELAARGDSAAKDDGVDLVPLAELAKGVTIDIVKLAGTNDGAGNHQAFVLLTKIGDGPSAVRRAHLDFLRRVLDPNDVSKLGTMPSGKAVERAIVIRRLVDAVAAGHADGGEPFENVGDVLIPLLGRGPSTLRGSVVSAVQVLIGWESEAVRVGTSQPDMTFAIDRLGSIIDGETPAEPRVLEDVSEVLWEVDGKRLLSHLIAGLARHSAVPEDDSARGGDPESARDASASKAAVALYLRELRSRLPLDFATVDGWSAWWKDHSEKSLPQIFIASQKKLSADQAAAWRRTLRRLRDTGDADGYLAELEEAVKSEYLVEKRLVAVASLGEFADFVRALKFSEPVSEQEKLRAGFLGRSCKLLLSIASGEARTHEFEVVSRRALSALQRYQSFLENEDPESVPALLRTQIVQLVRGRFDRLVADRPTVGGAASLEGAPRWRAEIVDIVRTAGALKVVETRGSIEMILSDEELLENSELTRAAVRALGRMAKAGLNEASAQLLVSLYEDAAKMSGPEAIELRVECANALQARPDTEAVRETLRGFYQKLLAQRDEPRLYIPAIGGLSTLAQEADQEAREALIGVLGASDQFDTPTLVAVVDAVAYIGGKDALELFLPFLQSRPGLQGKDQDVANYLLTKVKAAVRELSVEGLPWMLGRLETRAFESDDLSYLAFGVELARDPDFRGSLITGDQDVTVANGRLRAVWTATLAHLRALELSSRPVGEAADAVDDEYKKLHGFFEKESQLKEKEPELAAELDARSSARAARRALVGKLADALESGDPLDTQMLLTDFSDLTSGRSDRIVPKSDPVEKPKNGGNGGTQPKGDDTTPGAAPKAPRAPTARDRWAHLRWIEGVLKSEVVTKNAKLETLPQRWANFLSAEENSKLWEDLPVEFQTDYLRRVVPRADKTSETDS